MLILDYEREFIAPKSGDSNLKNKYVNI